MSTKSTNESECGSVTETQLSKKPIDTLEDIHYSDGAVNIFMSTYLLYQRPHLYTRQHIRGMETEMSKLFYQYIHSKSVNLGDILMLAHSYYNVGYVYLQTRLAGKLDIAKELSFRCFNLIEDKELNCKFILLALKNYHHLGYIYYLQHKMEIAIKTYDRAVELYLVYMQGNEKNGAVDLEDFAKLSRKSSGKEKMDILYTDILEAIIAIYEVKMPINNQNSVVYRHLLLVAKLNNLIKTKSYFKWIVDAMIVCDCLLKCNCFIEANNYITTAMSLQKMVSRQKLNTAKKQDSSLDVYHLDTEDKSMIFVLSSYWVKYGLLLLRRSAERLLRLEKSENSGTSHLKFKYPTKLTKVISQRLLLFDETCRPITYGCRAITVKNISDYNDAYKLFIQILTQLYNKRFCFNPVKEISLYMQFILDTSNAYKYMALYEKDTTSRTLLQNRRVDLLSKAVKNEICSMRPMLLKSLHFQLAIGYSTMINMKLENLETNTYLYMPQSHGSIMLEIENLLANALVNLKLYMRSLG